ncbi:tyrosine-type recombinase/integrase [Enterococcus sp. BWT-B8]|uniref:tyrosine-type recombinase/integrase n=1 Tax=Enterococcus sp. BWT-B8 TaxID=2885157 RepID=UPI002A0E69C8|nr:tyrosine-type recombinase/integrase [Enterococcus sp. BWT-B8]
MSQLNRYFQLVSTETNIKVIPHVMRHNFATQAIIAGVAAEHTASCLGYKNITMTEYYTHIKDETTSNVIDIMEARLSTNKEIG